MKIKLCSFIFLCAIFFLPFSTIAQQENTGEKSTTWKPLKLNAEGSNMASGVKFFYKIIVCGQEKLTLLGMVNNNNYAVTVSWKLDANSNKSVIIPASSKVSGQCSDTPTDIEKSLIIVNADTDTKTLKQNFISSLKVLRAEN